MAIIAVSDLHLGFDASDKAAFIQFLRKLQSDPNVTDLVLLGDIVDMWRRDSSRVFLENHDVLDLIIELDPEVIVAGHGPLCGIEGPIEMKAYLEYGINLRK